MLILLTNWFTRAERSRANAVLILGNPVTVTWMAAATGYLIRAVGWQMTFILEGIPSVLWAFVWIVVARDQPVRGAMAAGREQQASGRDPCLEQSSLPQYANLRGGAARAGRAGSVLPVFLLELRRVWPRDLDSGDDSLRIGAWYRADWPSERGAISSCRGPDADRRHFSDRVLHRTLFVWPFLILSGVALFCSFATAGHNFWLAYVCLVIAGGAMYAPYGPFFAIMPEMLPRNVAGEVIALVNSCGALGGFAGSWLVGWLQAVTGSSRAGYLAMSILLIVSGVMIFFLRSPKAAAEPHPA